MDAEEKCTEWSRQMEKKNVGRVLNGPTAKAVAVAVAAAARWRYQRVRHNY